MEKFLGFVKFTGPKRQTVKILLKLVQKVCDRVRIYILYYNNIDFIITNLGITYGFKM